MIAFVRKKKSTSISETHKSNVSLQNCHTSTEENASKNALLSQTLQFEYFDSCIVQVRQKCI